MPAKKRAKNHTQMIVDRYDATLQQCSNTAGKLKKNPKKYFKTLYSKLPTPHGPVIVNLFDEKCEKGKTASHN